MSVSGVVVYMRVCIRYSMMCLFSFWGVGHLLPMLEPLRPGNVPERRISLALGCIYVAERVVRVVGGDIEHGGKDRGSSGGESEEVVLRRKS